MRRSVLFLVLFVGLLLSACNTRPENILSEKKMENILVDLFLFEGTAQLKNMPVGDTLKTKYYNQILQKHGLTQQQYDSSLMWYVKNSEEYMRLQNKVMARLETINQEIVAGKYERPIAPTDSLDSVSIQTHRREVFVSANQRAEKSLFKLSGKDVVAGDVLKIRFQVRIEGVSKKQRAESIVFVRYTDSTEQVKKHTFDLSQSPTLCYFELQTEPKKQIDSVSINLLNKPTTIEQNQRVYFYAISLQRIFNPYRK